jgi:hypothetical protein
LISSFEEETAMAKTVKAVRGAEAKNATSRKRAPATSRKRAPAPSGKTRAIRPQEKQRLDRLGEKQRLDHLKLRRLKRLIEDVNEEVKKHTKRIDKHDDDIETTNGSVNSMVTNLRRIEQGDTPFKEGTLPWLIDLRRRLDWLEVVARASAAG